MISYELAKQLKDAGWKFQLQKHWNVVEIPMLWGNVLIDGEVYIQPTFSELIGACGDRFYALRKDIYRDGNKFMAMSTGVTEYTDNRGSYKSYNLFGYGKTPEEAVARLWLELNKKTHENNSH
jgi:hypothetical protein